MIDQENTLPFQITPSELFDAADKYFQATMANKRFVFQQKGMTGRATDDEMAFAELSIVTFPPCKLTITVWTDPNGLGSEVEFAGDLAVSLGQRDELEDAWSQFLRYFSGEQQRLFEGAVDTGPVAETQPDIGQEASNGSTSSPGKDKRGRSRYSEQAKRQAVEEWVAKDPLVDTELLSDFLDRKFSSQGGVPNVAESTFHEWKRKFK